ncbi:MAG: hypothetical protein CHACPFDD_03785 [Phycisphaerae bacterium]|nr:hypothetical protein [Phycisphaerae bacterium]
MFDSPRLLARPWREDDAEAAFLIYNDREVVHFIPQAFVQTVDEMRQRIAAIQERNRKQPPGMGSWPILEKSSGEMVGLVLLKPLPDDPRVEVGWHLARRVWGCGYATEAGGAALRHGFTTLGLDSIYAIVDPDNVRSSRVALRLGMRLLGLTDRFHNLTLQFYELPRANWLVSAAASAGASPEPG